MVEIIPVPLLTDNYAYLVHAGDSTVVIDPSTAAPVAEALRSRRWGLDAVLNTHHHWDHVGGNAELKREFGCEVVVAQGDGERIAAWDRETAGGQRLVIGELGFEVLFIPGHTLHHMALWMPEEAAVFTGDTLFLSGCGRLFEGTPAQMWESLSRLVELPPETRVYCGHEYTLANSEFALALTPEDPLALARRERVRGMRERGEPTVPGTIGEEKAVNPFLRLADLDYRERLYPGSGALEAFAALRKRKDSF